jgi:hypothetical protein
VILDKSHILKIVKAMKTADLLRHSAVAPSVGSELLKLRTTAVASFASDFAETAQAAANFPRIRTE